MKTLRLLSMLSLVGIMFSCKDGKENDGKIQLPAPVVAQDELRSGETQVAAVWSTISQASGYNVVFDDREAVTVNATDMIWENLEAGSEHLVKVQAVSGDNTKYSDSEWSEAVVLKTTGKVSSDSPYTITFSGIDFYKAEAHIVSSCNEDYFFQVTPKVLFDKEYGEEYAAFAADYISQVKQIAEVSEKTFGDMWLILKYDGSKENDFTISSLAPEVEYIAIAFGVDINGNITTECSSATFTTLKDPGFTPSEMTFEVSTEFVKETSVRVSVKPSVNDEYYFFAAINKQQLPGNTDEDIINYYLRQFAQYLDGETFESFAEENLSKGPDSYLYNDLDNNSEFVIVAFGVKYHGESCVASTGLTKKEFHTGEVVVDPEVNDIEIIVNKLNSKDIEASFIPSDKKKDYLYDFLTFDRFKGMTDDEIIAKVMADRSGYLWLTATKNNSTYKNVNDLVPGTEYILFAFYIEEDPADPYSAKPASKLFKQIVVVPGSGTEPEKPSLFFTISPDEVTATSIKATVTPSDASAKYISKLVEASKYAGKSDEEIMKGVLSDLGYDVYGSEKTGVSVLSSDKCKPGTEYLALAFGVDGSYKVNSGLTKRVIKTAASGNPPVEENSIAIAVKECTATSIVAEFTPADSKMQYIPTLYKASDIAEMTDEAIIAKMLKDNEENWYGLAVRGTNTLNRNTCPDTEYVLVAVGLKSMTTASTKLFKQTVKTLAN